MADLAADRAEDLRDRFTTQPRVGGFDLPDIREIMGGDAGYDPRDDPGGEGGQIRLGAAVANLLDPGSR